MSWLQIAFEADATEVERISAMLELCGALSVSIAGPDDEQRLQERDEALALWTRNRVTGLFPEDADSSAIIRQVAQVLGGSSPSHTIDILSDQDWACSWMAHYRPMEITPDLWICPSWCTPPRPDAVNIILDPGLAFGTGEHPTTAACLTWLAETSLRGKTVVDFGCGSGVLAIAALKLGAGRVIGIEIDPQARTVSEENARRNGVARNFSVIAPDEISPQLAVDIVIANILADSLTVLAGRITSMVKAGGRLVLTGLLADQADDVWARYARDFKLEQREKRREWVLLSGTKIAGHGGEKV